MMLRKTVFAIVVFISVINFASCSYADNPITKFSRGLCNLATFYLEIGEQSMRVKNEEGSVAGMTYGIGKGVVMSFVRAFVGVYEVISFPIPYPNGYGPILTDPVSFFPEPKKQERAEGGEPIYP